MSSLAEEWVTKEPLRFGVCFDQLMKGHRGKNPSTKRRCFEECQVSVTQGVLSRNVFVGKKPR